MIELILRSAVPSLGQAGDLVRVRPGYARNFLLPQGLAFEATAGNRKRIEAETKVRQAKQSAERAEAEALAAKLGSLALAFTAKAGEDGKLFGSVTAQDIADQVAAAGHALDKRRIELEHPLKTLGEHSVPVRLVHDVHTTLRVTISPEA